MTDKRAFRDLIEDATDDEIDRAGGIAETAREARSKIIGCWCAEDPRIRACPRCGEYEDGVLDGLLAATVATRLGVEITTGKVGA